MNLRSNKFYNEEGAGIGGAPAASAASVAPVSSAPAQSATPQANVGSVGTSAPASRSYKLKVNGAELELPEDKVIEYAQKGHSADQKYQEAAKLRKESQDYVDAYNQLNKMVTSKDFDSLEKVFGEEIVKGLVERKSPRASQEVEASEEDQVLANELGVDVKDIVSIRNKAKGTNLPAVNKVMQEVEGLKQHNLRLEKQLRDFQVKTQADTIESHFMNLSSKYPKASKGEVLNRIERENINPSKFEEVFKAEHDSYEKKKKKQYEEYAASKRKAANEALSSSNYGGVILNDNDYDGMTSDAKREKLKANLRKMGK